MMRIFLYLVIVGFVVLCGGLVVESGVFRNWPEARRGPCILLQQTAAGDKLADSDAPVEKSERSELRSLADFKATGGPIKNVTLGSVDPKSGFKFLLELTSKGAAIHRATLSEFNDRDPKDPQPLVILSPVSGTGGTEILSIANRELVLVQYNRQLGLHRLSWNSHDVEKAADRSQTARFEATIMDKDSGEPVLKLTKTYRVTPGSYHLDCSVSIENLSEGEQEVRFNLRGPVGIGREGVRGDMRKTVGGFRTSKGENVSSRNGIHGGFLSKQLGLKDATVKYEQALQTRDEEAIRQAREHLRIGHNLPDRYKNAKFLWAATTNKYFATILVPVPEQGQEYCDWVEDKTGWFYNPDGDSKGDSGDETVGVDLKIAPYTLGPAGQADSAKAYNFQLYLGPKDKSLFDKNPLYRRLGFVQTIDFLACCCPTAMIQPLAFGILALMKGMYTFIHNYGVVIIIFVFLVRLALHPLSKKSQVSMHKFTKFNSLPEVLEIRKKYGKNLMEMNKRMGELQRQHGIAPHHMITGFLPMFVQMPIWIALYSAIYASIELRGAAFLPVWITDLSVPDALFRFPAVTLPLLGKLDSFNLLPILMGVAFYLQQKLMPSQAAASANPQMAQQQKMMMIMMPLMFPLLLYKAPSGLNLYIMASTFAGVIEQHVIRKHISRKEEAESAGLVSATSKTGGKVKKKKPKPFFRYH